MDADLLVQRYVASKNPKLLDDIALACAPLVNGIASEFASKGFPRDDLLQAGYLGLLTAITTFDPARGVRFETYARPAVYGEMRHYLRDAHHVVRRPRWLDKLNRQIEATVERYVSTQGRFPTLGELASALNVTEDGLVEILKTRDVVRPSSLESALQPEEAQIDRRRIRHRTYESFRLPIEDRIVLLEAIEKLTDLQRRILYYLFYRDFTQQRTAEIIGISQKHVSRVLATALTRLREMLGSS